MTDPHRPDLPDRDPALDAAWKSHSTELPPAHIDAAILAAAHREGRTRPHSVGDDETVAHARGHSRAWWGLAAAATIGALAFGVVQLAPPPDADPAVSVATDIPRVAPEPAPAPQASSETPVKPAEVPRVSRAPVDAPVAQRDPPRKAAASTAPGPAPTSPLDAAKPRSDRGEQKLARVDERDRQRGSAADPVPATPALGETPAASPASPPESATPAPRPFPGGSSPAAAPAAPVASFAAPSAGAEKSAAAGSAVNARRREAEQRPAANPATQPPSPRRAQADAASQATAATAAPKLPAVSPAAWIERIRKLHAEQRFDDAARELNLFRDAYPDADLRLPVELRNWAASIRRN